LECQFSNEEKEETAALWPMSGEEESPERTKFLVELEFVQCLANPHYLGWLAQEG
jgi:hypothetical protein